jgi:hypothetical protein
MTETGDVHMNEQDSMHERLVWGIHPNQSFDFRTFPLGKLCFISHLFFFTYFFYSLERITKKIEKPPNELKNRLNMHHHF